jgi:hypothetical protein
MNKDEAESCLYICILIQYKNKMPQIVKSWGIQMVIKTVLYISNLYFTRV